MKKRVLVLGATGSIGQNTLSVIDAKSEEFCVAGLVANSSLNLAVLCQKYSCPAVLVQRDGEQALKTLIASCKADIVVNGIAGVAGVMPSIWVLKAGIPLALANKESITMAWSLLKNIATEGQIIPVDSEHSAVASLIAKCGSRNVKNIILTASGGPFYRYTKEELAKVTVLDALKHPTWSMGKQITVDSASMANKGLEVIEAARLFDKKDSEIEVVIHRQSIVHSLVRTIDGVLYAQMSKPDMRYAIYSALTFPTTKESPLAPYNLVEDLCENEEFSLTFSKPRDSDFRLLPLARMALKTSEKATIAYTVANEIAACAFLQKQIGFLQIATIVEETLQHDWQGAIQSVHDMLDTKKIARIIATKTLESMLK